MKNAVLVSSAIVLGSFGAPNQGRAQVLTTCDFNSTSGYAVGTLLGQGTRAWYEDSAIGVYDVSASLPKFGDQKAIADTGPLFVSSWAWQDVSAVSISNSSKVVVATVRVHVSDDNRTASFAGLDCYQASPSQQLLGIKFQPTAGPTNGGVYLMQGLNETNLGLPAPALDSWHTLRIFIDINSAEGAAEIDGYGVYKTTPINLAAQFTPFVSRFADADLFVDPWGFNLVSFDNYRVEAVPRGTYRGHIDLEGWAAPVAGRPVSFEVRNSSGVPVESHTVNLAADSTYSVIINYSGNGYIVAKASHWLARSTPLIPITKFGIFDLDFSLTNGDIDGDNEVAIGDYAILSSSYNKELGDPGYAAAADLNGDDAVDIADYAILSANYGQVGD